MAIERVNIIRSDYIEIFELYERKEMSKDDFISFVVALAKAYCGDLKKIINGEYDEI